MNCRNITSGDCGAHGPTLIGYPPKIAQATALGRSDYTAGHPDSIELCGHCGRRVFRVGPEQRVYCEKCGHGPEHETVAYLRESVVADGVRDVARELLSPQSRAS